ncbi:alpha-N-acetylglucosaminidase [Sulfuriroseicoccus oceanibius]|uniref:Alpha-N-acetylglucosaminidase n=1 Tax=Sulfuriroseicoccus oceanibius TaxID=2707525 RepID=A0A6B3LE94_9BACT|nr:alpha-N-acetylglucosaminidase [Sulfuriroseicoccus oceanibius]QQL44468.1 alpha-N-acetylglucosaminidase [Sulfuriroseicoccus oceanibius]
MNLTKPLWAPMRRLTWITLCTLMTLGALPAASPALDATKGVLKRTLGEEAAARIELAPIPQENGQDVYEYSATPEKLTVKGSSQVAMCRGVYDYLRAKKLGTVGWAGARLNIPEQWPVAEPTRQVCPFKIRHSYNVVTAGYTFPYWTWERWEQELDWQAMHGFNMAMAPVATEAIATKVWLGLGLKQEEIDRFYTGPAHLPWQRMGNIQNVGGTLTAAWHRDQIALQHKILKRMRELGMEPVVQAFAGFVPEEISRVFPDAELHKTSWEAGFGQGQRPVVMMPDTPAFAKIMKRYLTEWQKEFGDARYILVDSFNEMKLPKTGTPPTELLRGYGGATYKAITSAIPDAVWVLQGWMFSYQRYIWNNETMGALLQDVPDDKLFILDYAHDYNPGWDYFDAFHGKTWAMGFVPNMGGKTAYVGKIDFYASQAAKVLASPDKGNLVGFTISGEALENNEVIYEVMSDSSWSKDAIGIDTWLPAYVENRYQTGSQTAIDAWMELRRSVYSSFTDHPHYGWQKGAFNRGTAHRSDAFVAGIQKFLSVADELHANANYRDDAIEMAAQALGMRADEWFILAQSRFTMGMIEESKEAGEQAIELLLEADRLLESHSYLRMASWIDFARSHDGSAEEKNDWERSARQLVTIWGPPINDYSCRLWSGLIRDFYAPRMQKQLEAMWTGESFNRAQWEAAWVKSLGLSPVEPYANPALAAAEAVQKAYSKPLPNAGGDDREVVGRWTPDQIGTEWTTIEWQLPTAKLKTLKGVTFLYTRGKHRLDIQSAAVIADGNEVAIDKHDGSTGLQHVQNFYRLKIPEGTQANNSCVLRVVVRSDGGTDSFGEVFLVE